MFTPLNAYSARRQRLMAKIDDMPVVLAAGRTPSRNFPANLYSVRSSSHFLYFVGQQMNGAVLVLDQGQSVLYVNRPPTGDDLWHGPAPSLMQLGDSTGCTVKYIDELKPETLQGGSTLPVMDQRTNQWLTTLLERTVPIGQGPLSDRDKTLATAIIDLRLIHDEAAIRELKRAAQVTVEAHQAAREVIMPGRTEHDVWAVMQSTFTRHGMGSAYPPIITTAGEILHGRVKGNVLKDGDLLLMDVGAETENGWAADVTRTCPVSGTFSPTQALMYDVVYTAHQAAINAVRPGIRYRDIHLTAARTMASGLVDVGLLRGSPDDLVNDNVHALFFPHGVGHLIGLDVHDMEDLGDLAGYTAGQPRSKRFGECYLRLDRVLDVGMAITIEPGFYRVPSLLAQMETFADVRGRVNLDVLEQFSDVRGIRIEDDILVCHDGCEVLTRDLPAHRADV